MIMVSNLLPSGVVTTTILAAFKIDLDSFLENKLL